MKELAQVIERGTMSPEERKDGNHWADEHWRKAVEQWTLHALCAFTGDLLIKALAVSAAMAEFDNEVQTGKGER